MITKEIAMLIAGGIQIDCLTHAGESYISTLGLAVLDKKGNRVLVTSGHAVGDKDPDHDGSIQLPNGQTIGKVSYNAYLKGPKNSEGPEDRYPGPDVAAAEAGTFPVVVPFLVALGGGPGALPVLGSQEPNMLPPMAVQVQSFAGQVLGFVEETEKDVEDAVTRLKVKKVAVASYTYSGNKSAAGAPVLYLDLKMNPPILKIVGIHGGEVWIDDYHRPTQSWFVPWSKVLTALDLPPFPGQASEVT